jgi:hypothetical protein
MIMEIFKLISYYKIESDGSVNVCLKPENVLINEYIATYRTFENLSLADSSLNEYIEEMTIPLYNDFMSMENVQLEIRNKFIL